MDLRYTVPFGMTEYQPEYQEQTRSCKFDAQVFMPIMMISIDFPYPSLICLICALPDTTGFAPENGWLEYFFLLGPGLFSVPESQ